MNQEAVTKKDADVSTTLAHERTDVAFQRTRMAAERTLMAWIRTSLSMISFGFTILKFFEYLRQSQGPLGKFSGEGARHFGLALICVGTSVLIPAVIENLSLMKGMSRLDGKSPWSLALIVAIVVGGLGILAFISGLFHLFF
jgi:putative membrane protein